MVARITLEADNQTGKGFDDLIDDAEAAADATAELAESAEDVNEELNPRQLIRYNQELIKVNDGFNESGRLVRDLGDGVQLLDKRTRGWNVTTIAATSEAQQEFRALREEVHATLKTMVRLEESRREGVQQQGKDYNFLTDQFGKFAREQAETAGSIAGGYLKTKLAIFAVKRALKGVAATVAGSLGAAAGAAAAAVGPIFAVATAAKGVHLAFQKSGREMRMLGGENGKLTQFTDLTSEAIREQTGIVARNNRELAQALNATGSAAEAQQKLQEVMRATGKTAEELGVEATSNAKKWGDAFSDLGGRLVKPFVDSGRAIKDWWDLTNIFSDVWKKMDTELTEFTDQATEDLGLIADGWDHVRAFVGQASGANREEYLKEIRQLRKLREEHKKLEEHHERTKDDFARLGNLNRGLEKEAELRRELNRLGEVKLKQINNEMHKLRQRAGELANNNEFEGRAMEEITMKMRLLSNRRIQLEREEAAARKKAIQDYHAKVKQEQMEREQRERQLAWERMERFYREQRQRRELREKTKLAIQDFETAIKNQRIDGIKHNMDMERAAIDRQIEMRKKAGQGYADLEHKRQLNLKVRADFEKMQARNRLHTTLTNLETEKTKEKEQLDWKIKRRTDDANEELQRLDDKIAQYKKEGKEFANLQNHRKHVFEEAQREIDAMTRRSASLKAETAETELAKRKAVLQAELELRQIDQREKQQAEIRKAQVAIEQAEREAQAKIAAHNKLKAALQEGKDQGKSVAQGLIGGLDQEKVFDQIVANRVAQAKKGKGDMTKGDLIRLQKQIRIQTFRQAKKGELDILEVRKAQSQQAAAVLKKARADGRLSQSQVKALADATDELLKIERDQVQLERDVENIKKQIGEVQNSGRRRRAQRAGR